MSRQPQPMSAPTVTVAIPLHASAPWFDVVVDTIGNLPPLVTEILVSDRTMLDDTAERVRAECAGDPRVRVVTGADGLHWTDHLQSLLEAAGGEYLFWMPHDDSADSTWVPEIVGALERHPDAWLAFGRLVPVLADGVTPHPTWVGSTHRAGRVGPWRLHRMLLAGELGIPFRGGIRRRSVLDAGIRVAEVHGSQLADIAWVHRVGLRAPLLSVPSTSTRKRVHAGSTFLRWRREPGDLARLGLANLVHDGVRGVRGTLLRTWMRAAHRWAVVTDRPDR